MIYFIYLTSFYCFVVSVVYHSETLGEFSLIIIPAMIMILSLIKYMKQD